MKFRISLIFILFMMLLMVGCSVTEPTDLSKCKMIDKTYIYDGKVKSLRVTNVPSDAIVDYINNEQTEIGEYEVIANISYEGETKELKAKLSIIQDPELTPFANCQFSNVKTVYNGEPVSIYVENLPENATVTYSGNGQVNAGRHKVVATLTAENGIVEEKVAYITIEKASSEIIVEENQIYVLVGSHLYPLEASINNDEQKVVIEPSDEITGPGVYKFKASAAATTNYKTAIKYFNVNVIKNTMDIELPDQTFVYDGENKALSIVGDIPEGYTVDYINNNHSEPGTYRVRAVVRDQNGNPACQVFGTLFIDKAKNPEFEQFMDELFVLIFEGDQMSINFFFKNPEDYGLEHYEAELPVASFGNFEEGIQQLEDILAELRVFDFETLSSEQQMSYKIVEDYFVYLSSITEPMDYMTNGYLGSYLGYQSNLPLNLAEYKFRNELDIQDFIKYLKHSEVAFQSYYQFCVKQIEYGYGLTDIAIDNVVSQCEKFVAEKENHYLIDIFNDKIDNIEFELSQEVIDSYKAEAKAAIQNELCNAYQYVADNLPNLKGAEIIEGGLYYYGQEGLDYFELMLRNTLGYSDLTIEEAIAYIDQKFLEANAIVSDIVTQYQNLPSREAEQFYNAAVEGEPAFSKMEPHEVVEYFKQMSETVVPTLDIMPEINIKLVYESLQENFSPAAYFVSPIDETRFESIYLNPKYIEDLNYIFTTLAHEGYPGHLYQNIYTKQLDISNFRKVIGCGAYTEGWATYVEMKSYSWAPNYTTKPLLLALEYLQWNSILNGLLSCRVDLGIHGEGWHAEDIAEYMNETLGGGYTAADMEDFYNQVVEIPTNMTEYFYGYAKLQDMHDYAQETLGYAFNEVEFNKTILDCGEAPLQYVEEAVEKYIEDTLYKWGLSW